MCCTAAGAETIGAAIVGKDDTTAATIVMPNLGSRHLPAVVSVGEFLAAWVRMDSHSLAQDYLVVPDPSAPR